MATFRVGQRFRKVASNDDAVKPTPIGTCGVVTEVGPVWGYTKDDEIISCDYLVLMDGNTEETTLFQWQMEPIQDDGRKVVDWSECLWQPNENLVAA